MMMGLWMGDERLAGIEAADQDKDFSGAEILFRRKDSPGKMSGRKGTSAGVLA